MRNAGKLREDRKQPWGEASVSLLAWLLCSWPGGRVSEKGKSLGKAGPSSGSAEQLFPGPLLSTPLSGSGLITLWDSPCLFPADCSEWAKPQKLGSHLLDCLGATAASSSWASMGRWSNGIPIPFLPAFLPLLKQVPERGLTLVSPNL